jgi:hypothetical protein
MPTNLPTPNIEDSATGTKLFFDNYGEAPLEFLAIEVDIAVSFFNKKGFDNDAAISVSSVLLKQAKLEGIPISQILDTLAGIDELNISSLVSEILNNNRTPTSILGYKLIEEKVDISRNISA